ncbi:hypothetical protein [Nocardia sp. NPDC019395]|uniref:hypothetical protein n=1 Tax=Nocardia sp. NPDC019395 TaxID=3154686 RepID=UPI0033D15B24
MRCSRVIAAAAVAVFGVLGWAAVPAASAQSDRVVYACEQLFLPEGEGASIPVDAFGCSVVNDAGREARTGSVEGVEIRDAQKGDVFHCSSADVDEDPNSGSGEKLAVEGFYCDRV